MAAEVDAEADSKIPKTAIESGRAKIDPASLFYLIVAVDAIVPVIS